MSKDPKSILIGAAAVLSLPSIGSASKSPELMASLAKFGSINVGDYDCDEFVSNPARFDDGPVTCLSEALGNSDYADRVKAIVDEHNDVIVGTLGPAVEQVRRILGYAK